MPSFTPNAETMLRNLSSFLTPSSTPPLAPGPDGLQTAKQHSALFPATDPQIDGEACLRDCETCTIHYPRKFQIDEDDRLYGHIQGWSRHLIVATGKTDWVRAVEDEKGSVMEAVGRYQADMVEGGRLMLSASNIPTEADLLGGGDGKGNYGQPTRCLLLPAFQWVNGVLPRHVPHLIKGTINKAPTNTQRLHAPDSGESNGFSPSYELPAGLSLAACPHKYLVLLCSQATRDARCGQSAPLLRRELERHLRPLGLYRDLGDERPGGVGIYFISHVGGHKYSANMLVYRRADVPRSGAALAQAEGGGTRIGEGEAAQCIWLARVRPEDCENIVRFTVLQGKVVKPERQLRGGFDREKGVVSW